MDIGGLTSLELDVVTGDEPVCIDTVGELEHTDRVACFSVHGIPKSDVVVEWSIVMPGKH